MTWGGSGYNRAVESEMRFMQNHFEDLNKTNKSKNPSAQDKKQGGAQNKKQGGEAQNKSQSQSQY